MRNLLILNTPGYPNWHGPYLNEIKADPWGHHYSVVMFGGTYYASCAGGLSYWCRNSIVVASSGPNGIWESDPHMDRGCSTNWDPHSCGDDLFVVVMNRAGSTAASVAP